MKIPKPIPATWLEDLYSSGGAIRVKDLVDGEFYYGSCRNATVARWDAAKHKFTYVRYKFGDQYLEDINCLEEDDGYDLFVPVRKTGSAQAERDDINAIKELMKLS